MHKMNTHSSNTANATARVTRASERGTVMLSAAVGVVSAAAAIGLLLATQPKLSPTPANYVEAPDDAAWAMPQVSTHAETQVGQKQVGQTQIGKQPVAQAAVDQRATTSQSTGTQSTRTQSTQTQPNTSAAAANATEQPGAARNDQRAEATVVTARSVPTSAFPEAHADTNPAAAAEVTSAATPAAPETPSKNQAATLAGDPATAAIVEATEPSAVVEQSAEAAPKKDDQGAPALEPVIKCTGGDPNDPMNPCLS